MDIKNVLIFIMNVHQLLGDDSVTCTVNSPVKPKVAEG